MERVVDKFQLNIRLSKFEIETIDQYVNNGLYINRPDFARMAIREMISKLESKERA